MTGKPTKQPMLLCSSKSLCLKWHPKVEDFQCGDYVEIKEKRGIQKKMIKFVFLDCSIWSKARLTALISAENKETLSRNRHFYVSGGVTQADPAVPPSCEPSVNKDSWFRNAGRSS